MGFSTHLGPWLLGTVKETTGTSASAGQVRNLGSTVVSQTFQKDYTGTTTSGRTDVIATLPAGAQINSINIDTLTAFTGSTAANLTLGDGTTANKFLTTTNLTTQGRAAIPATAYASWSGAASAAAPNGIGIGPTDVQIVATMTPTVATVTAGLVQYTVVYTVRNSDGNNFPASA